MRTSSLMNVCVAGRAVTGLLLTGSVLTLTPTPEEGPEKVFIGVKAETEVVPAATKVSIAPINFNERTILKCNMLEVRLCDELINWI